MDIRFDAKTAIVTGAASGIGLAIAQQLAASGARIVLADLEHDKTEAAADAIGHGALAFVADVTKPDAVAALVAFAQEKTGALNLMVNNAGIGGPITPLGAYEIAEWSKVIDVNLNGVFYGLRYAIPAITAAGGRCNRQYFFDLGFRGLCRGGGLCGDQTRAFGADQNGGP